MKIKIALILAKILWEIGDKISRSFLINTKIGCDVYGWVMDYSSRIDDWGNCDYWDKNN